MKGGKGQGGRSGLPWDHVILLSAGNLLFLVNMSAGSDLHCLTVEALGDRATHPAATCNIIITVNSYYLILSVVLLPLTSPPPSSPRPRHASVPSSQGELHRSVNTVLLYFCGGWMLEPRWSSLAGGLPLLL